MHLPSISPPSAFAGFFMFTKSKWKSTPCNAVIDVRFCLVIYTFSKQIEAFMLPGLERKVRGSERAESSGSDPAESSGSDPAFCPRIKREAKVKV